MSDTTTPVVPISNPSPEGSTTIPSLAIDAPQITIDQLVALMNSDSQPNIDTPKPNIDTPPISEPTTLSPQPDDDYVLKAAHLIKKEKQLSQQQLQLKDIQEQAKQFASLKEMAKTNPLGILEAFGLEFDQLADTIINNADPEAAKFKEVKSEIESLKQQLQQEKNQAIENKRIEAKENFKSHIKQASENDTYEFIRHNKAYDMVYDLCEAYYNNNKQMLPLNQAMQQVESYLEEQASSILQLNKVKSKLQQEPKKDLSPSLSSLPPSSAAVETEATTQQDLFNKALAYLK